jgi:hypothetical protein
LFAFEELENSLHPALVRKLMPYVCETVRATNSHVVFTTHSNVAIDYISGLDDAQILHTSHPTPAIATVRSVTGYNTRRELLRDLDVRASDLLQANGIVWVEGPSDRIYLNRWIDLVTQGQLREGVHYQCIFYGGKLLARLSAAEPGQDADSLVELLRVNGNVAVVIDSDRSATDDPINQTKQRIEREVHAAGGYVWITFGREIENYLTAAAIAHVETNVDTAPQRFQDICDFLEQHRQGAGKKFERGKADFAALASDGIRLDEQSRIGDWQEKIEGLVAHIRRWNKL